MLEVLRCTVKSNTLGIKETIAFLGENFVLDWLDPALNINGPNSTHGEKRLGNLLVDNSEV